MPEATNLSIGQIYSMMDDEAYSGFRWAMRLAKHGVVRVVDLLEGLRRTVGNDATYAIPEGWFEIRDDDYAPQIQQPLTNHPKLRQVLFRSHRIAIEDPEPSQSITCRHLLAAIAVVHSVDTASRNQVLHHLRFVSLIPSEPNRSPVQRTGFVRGPSYEERPRASKIPLTEIFKHTSLTQKIWYGLQLFVLMQQKSTTKLREELGQIVQAVESI